MFSRIGKNFGPLNFCAIQYFQPVKLLVRHLTFWYQPFIHLVVDDQRQSIARLSDCQQDFTTTMA